MYVCHVVCAHCAQAPGDAASDVQMTLAQADRDDAVLQQLGVVDIAEV
jgi:hypothetical protein